MLFVFFPHHCRSVSLTCTLYLNLVFFPHHCSDFNMDNDSDNDDEISDNEGDGDDDNEDDGNDYDDNEDDGDGDNNNKNKNDDDYGHSRDLYNDESLGPEREHREKGNKTRRKEGKGQEPVLFRTRGRLFIQRHCMPTRRG